jgi:chromosome segregation ATPase
MENLDENVKVKAKRVCSKEHNQRYAVTERQRRENMNKKLAEADRVAMLENKLKRIKHDEEELKQMENLKEKYNQTVMLLNQRNEELELKVKELMIKAMDLERTVTELKQERDGLVMDLDYYKQLEGQLHKLQECLETVESEKYQMELNHTMKSNNDSINETIVNNTRVLIGQLPQNSPFRQPLLSFLLQGLSFKEVVDLYGISQQSYGRIMEDDGSTLTNQKYAINVTRQQISEDQIDDIKKILNDILPVVSG